MHEPVPTHRDAGMTLIELIVGIIVSMLVLGGIATVLINSFITQNSVLSTSEATNRGQLVGSAVEKAMRNAVYSTVTSGGTVLLVETTFDAPGDTRHCQAFRLADKTAQTASSATDITVPAWGTWLEDDAARQWTVLVRQNGSTPFFAQTDPTQPNGGVRYVFDIETDSAPVVFRGEVRPEWQPAAGGDATCW
ncbi:MULTISPECIES: prepilin-type N-terminal cleavage/methylation domain-containing protein [Microbacterium]|uniref:PilW family protein n=1 Tax=Microbacterium TaxID=33882 RepID=UPI000D657DEA|nr:MULTISPECIES: prepilin-type N-terminal cleavage/methylation domain-containing protein [Microbacterium]